MGSLFQPIPTAFSLKQTITSSTTFTSTGTVNNPQLIGVVIMGGGASGGATPTPMYNSWNGSYAVCGQGNGGGGSGYITIGYSMISGPSPITVGAGGAASTAGGSGNNGGASNFLGFSANGGNTSGGQVLSLIHI